MRPVGRALAAARIPLSGIRGNHLSAPKPAADTPSGAKRIFGYSPPRSFPSRAVQDGRGPGECNSPPAAFLPDVLRYRLLRATFHSSRHGAAAHISILVSEHGNPAGTARREGGALPGLCRHAISRGLAARTPQPSAKAELRPTARAPPRIRYREGSGAPFSGIGGTSPTLRALPPFLHGARLRTGEAVRLSVRDVDFRDAALPPRNTIFFRKRLPGVPMRCGPAMCVGRNAQCRRGPLRLVSRTGTERRLPMPRPRDHSAAWASWPSLSARDQCRSKRSSVITFAHAATKSCKNASCASSPA